MRRPAAFASKEFFTNAELAELDRHRVTPNITYQTANNWDAKLDVYQASEVTTPNPTIKVSLAPAAVEDCRCALRWVYRNAKQYNFDLNRLVVTGQSSGGHLALMTGMPPVSTGLDSECPGNEELKVAAIINWYGITDVGEVLDGPNMRPFAVTWLGSGANREALAKRISPLTYVRPGLPPILSIQGDADPTVPYPQSVRLRQALDKAGVPNEHVTVPGGKHGNFPEAEYVRIYGVIRSFLTKHNLPTVQGGKVQTSSSQP